jgi:hypothetical protein
VPPEVELPDDIDPDEPLELPLPIEPLLSEDELELPGLLADEPLEPELPVADDPVEPDECLLLSSPAAAGSATSRLAIPSPAIIPLPIFIVPLPLLR